jgi:hypothetical protein
LIGLAGLAPLFMRRNNGAHIGTTTTRGAAH